jgi:hypothetical protein
MTDFEEDDAFGRRYLVTVAATIAPYVLTPAPFELDVKEATDLVSLVARRDSVAVRIRRHGYAEQYPYEFTIRSHRPNGVKTEATKIIYEGHGEYLFYGHAARGDVPLLTRWVLIDLRRFRGAICRIGASDLVRRGLMRKRRNSDGTRFIACDVRLWPQDIITAASFSLKPGPELAIDNEGESA